jgi:hypothetical protein
MQVSNKIVFKTKDKAGNEISLAVKKPNILQSKDINKAYNLAWKEAVENGGVLRAAVEELARKQGVWDESKQKEYVALQKQLGEAELKLKAGGGAGLTVKKARDLALEMVDLRTKMIVSRSPLNDLDSNTIEAQAENAKFNHTVALCTVKADTGDNFFKSYEDYIERLNEGEQATVDAIKNMSFLAYNLDPNFESNRPETKFLKDYKFTDDKGRLVNKDGKLVDRDGRLVREDGRFINEKNELVDMDGNLVDEEGNYKVEFKPFLSEEEIEK